MTPQVELDNRTYTAEVLNSRNVARSIGAIARLLRGEPNHLTLPAGTSEAPAEITHGFVASKVQYHRTIRQVIGADGKKIDTPRQEQIRGQRHFMYDVVIISRAPYVLVAVPFHGLAEEFFVQVDRALAGSRVVYERLNITQMVMHLGRSQGDADGRTLGVTRCQLAYSDPEQRSSSLQQLRMVGANLRESKVYEDLIKPVLEPRRSRLLVTPVLLGFALFDGGVKRSSAVTDRHGNFKLWIGNALTRTARIFTLLDQVAEMANVVDTTSNLPILQSRVIREGEGE